MSFGQCPYIKSLQRIGIMKHALRLHKEAGCEHGELEPENVVMHNGDLDSMQFN